MEVRYYVCGLGYDKDNCVTDYECDFGDFDTYEEAYECFVKVQCSSPYSLFSHPLASYQMLIQLEECEETENEINCIDVKNEWWVINPNFEEEAIMEKNEIRVKINGGYLVAGRNPDPMYDGIYIGFETDDGLVADVVVVESKEEDKKENIDVYTYEDEYTEDWTRKYTLRVKEFNKAFNGEEI